jgi:hypothetical protein
MLFMSNVLRLAREGSGKLQGRGDATQIPIAALLGDGQRSGALMARDAENTNYEEAKVAAYSLPDPLSFPDGAPVATAQAWFNRRRPAILELFETHVYGRSPGKPTELSIEIISEDADALDGLAIRREAKLLLGTGAPTLHLLIYLPKRSAGPAPVMLGPNFLGNHSVHPDPGIRLPEITFVQGMDVALAEGCATDASRGFHSERWPIERILARGYAVATFYYGDLFPDRADGRPLSIQPLFDRAPQRFSWGAIATWSWSMSRALDALETMPDIDARRAALMGHSRHGKAALWAGATDRRFALVIANDSGKGGASITRRNFGETIRHLTTRYPPWFGEAYSAFAGREGELPVDQHMLIALQAPRPVYIASAADDLWADPKGEFLGALNASPVYRLLGIEGLAAEEMPETDQPVTGTIGYHLRSGGHGVTAWDWERFLDFADRHML